MLRLYRIVSRVGLYTVLFWLLDSSLQLLLLVYLPIPCQVIPSRVTETIKHPLTATVLQPTNAALFSHDASCLDYHTNPNSTANWFKWKASNGSTLSVPPKKNLACDNSGVVSTLDETTALAHDYAYTVGGIPVLSGAVGAPYARSVANFEAAFMASQGSKAFLAASSDFYWATQCFPAMVRNPVKCVAGGKVTMGTNHVNVTVGDCGVSSAVYGVDVKNGGASAAGACTDGHAIGTATLVLGSVNVQAANLEWIMNNTLPNTTTQAVAMNNQAYTPVWKQGSTYSVSCTVNILPSISFRFLNLSRNTNGAGSTYLANTPLSIASSGRCTPPPGTNLSTLLTETALATAASASLRLLTQRQYNDGWWPTLHQMARGVRYLKNIAANEAYIEEKTNTLTEQITEHRDPKWAYAFPDSTNALEDVLGRASGIALGFYLGSNVTQRHKVTPFVPFEGSVSVNGIRVGPGTAWSIVYIIPSLFSAVLMAVLAWQIRRAEAVGGRIEEERGVGKEKIRGSAATKYVARC